ncbi:hypothetical protein P4S68_11690 [Pseudoalteromonas sp. Hal099]
MLHIQSVADTDDGRRATTYRIHAHQHCHCGYYRYDLNRFNKPETNNQQQVMLVTMV